MSPTDKDDLDRPITRAERIKFIVFPWVIYTPLLYLGAWIRTFPTLPPVFRGLWFTPLVSSLSMFASGFVLGNSPRVIRERHRKNEFRGEKPDEPFKEHVAQRLLMVFMSALIFVSSYEAADRVVNDEPDLPWAIYLTGSVLILSSILLISWVMRVNRFAAKVVYKQPGQELITTGPYSIVRHPFYTFMIPLMVGWPWIMGSLWKGLIASLPTVPVLMWRTYHEEDF